MGELFDIPSDIRTDMRKGFNDLLDFNGINCKLVYPPIMEACDNCVYDPIGNTSSNKWLHGGPIPFDFGLCPVCGGQYSRAIAQEEEIKLQFNFNPAQWKKLPIPNIEITDGMVLTKGKLENLPKVQRCIYMVASLATLGMGEDRYEKKGPTLDGYSIVHGYFFVCFWTRF